MSDQNDLPWSWQQGSQHFRLNPTQANSPTWSKLGSIWPPTWLELGWVGVNLDEAQIFAQLKPRFSTSHLSQLLPSCFVIVRRLCIHSCNGFLVIWLNLAVPFGHLLMLRFSNLAWVGSSWEYCLDRAGCGQTRECQLDELAKPTPHNSLRWSCLTCKYETKSACPCCQNAGSSSIPEKTMKPCTQRIIQYELKHSWKRFKGVLPINCDKETIPTNLNDYLNLSLYRLQKNTNTK